MKLRWSLIYFLVFLPWGLFRSVFGDPLYLRLRPESKSYWIHEERRS